MSRGVQTGEASASLSVRDLRHAYGRTVALQGVSLDIGAGELVCLVGPSGCGKSTLLRLVAGLEDLQSGGITIGGRVVASPDRQLPPEQRGVGIVFQDYALFPHLTVAENVVFGLRGLSARSRREAALAALAQVELTRVIDAYPHMLSGGEQQRVALARALAPRPPVMLLDEPFSNLDPRLRDQVRDDTLHILKRSDTATLLVTHDPEEAMFMADRIAVMQRGRIEQLGSPYEIYYRPQTPFVARFFGQVNTLTGQVAGGLVETAFGPVPTGGLPEGTPVQVLVRPEAVRIADGGVPARVLAARLLGPVSLLHLCVAEDTPLHAHLHARVPGRFLPQEDSTIGLALDPGLAFVFPQEADLASAA